MFQRVNYGPVTKDENGRMKDLSPREWTILAPVVALSILMGVLPAPFLKPMEPSVNRVVERVMNRQPAVVKTLKLDPDELAKTDIHPDPTRSRGN
jgi:NADH-quinone oxidoreductase subunit M